MADGDAFQSLLNLEDDLYFAGYRQGIADGDRAGRIEGRSLGLEKGFDKFVEAGRLNGKAIIWANRLAQAQATRASSCSSSPSHDENKTRLVALSVVGARMQKNIVTLHALTETDTLSTENTDEAVNDFDDRVRKAQGKARVIERQIGDCVAPIPSNKEEGSNTAKKR